MYCGQIDRTPTVTEQGLWRNIIISNKSTKNKSDLKPSNKGNDRERPENLKQKNSLNELNT